MPTVALVESGGADLPTQKEIFIPGGKLFRDITRSSAAKVPTIAIVFGNSTAGGAYVPGMSDYTVMVKEQAKVFLGGPPLVKMATGEESDDESLGGAEMHARISGLADYLAVDEHDALRIGRRIVARLNQQKTSPKSRDASAGSDCSATPQRGRAVCGAGGGCRGAARPDPHRPQGAVRPARGDPAGRRRCLGGERCRLRRVQAALRQLAGHRLGADPRPPGRHPRQRAGRAVQRGGAEGDPVHPAGQPGRRTPAVPAQHHRLHGRQGVRAGRHHQARCADDQRGEQQQGAAHLDHHGCVVRRRELRHERPGLRPAVPVHLAECEVRGDGPGPARRGALHRRASRGGGQGQGVRRRCRRGDARVRGGERRGAEPAVLPLRDVVRRRGDRPARHPDDPRHLPVRDHRNQPIEGTDRFGVFRM